MRNTERKLDSLRYLFTHYLHQDWTVEGEYLSDIFEQYGALQDVAKEIKQEAESLLEEVHDNKHLDDIFFNHWSIAYENEKEGSENWSDVVREIVGSSGRYSENK